MLRQYVKACMTARLKSLASVTSFVSSAQLRTRNWKDGSGRSGRPQVDQRRSENETEITLEAFHKAQEKQFGVNTSNRNIQEKSNILNISENELRKWETNSHVRDGNVGEYSSKSHLEDLDYENDSPNVISLDPDEIKIFQKLKQKSKPKRVSGVPVTVRNITYFDMEDENKLLNKVMVHVKSSKSRENFNLIMLEGKRLIEDALDSGLSLDKLFFSRLSDIENFKLPEKALLYKVLYRHLKLWSDVKTPQGVIGVFQKPKQLKEPLKGDFIPLTIVCDNVRDPQNMGCIIRTAASVGCKKLILTIGCVDIWDPKVLRAGAGSHFRLPIVKSQSWDKIRDELKDSMLCLADNDSPIAPDSEVGENVGNAQNIRTSAFQKKYMYADNLPLVPYFSKKYWKERPVVLILGGETTGLSEEAYRLGNELKAERVYIPLSNNVESLNCNTALSVIAYEMKRQYILNDHAATENEKVPHNESFAGVGLYSE